MLSIGKSSGDKTGLGFDGSTNSSSGTTFVKASGTYAMPKTCVLTCHACGEVGHIRPFCDKKYLNHSDTFSIGAARTQLSNLLREANRLSKLVHIPNSWLPKMKLVWREKKRTKSVNESHCCLLTHSSIKSNDFKCFVAFTALDSCNPNKWYFDSGCSRHMTGDKRWFQTFSDKKVRGTVTFGDGKKAKLSGEGTVTAPGLPALHNVLLVENLTANLMSISQLCDDFGKVIFDEIECIVSTKTGEKVICGPRSDDNCYCAMANGLNVCYRVENNITNLWHRRLGHMNFRDLFKISKKEYVRGLPTLSGKQEGVCGDCQIGKQTKSSHSPTNFASTSKPLELMHMDLVGPMQTLSLGGKKYILVLVDDFTRFTWVAFLHDKSEAFKSFSVICMKIQNEKHDNLIRLRTDHGTEFENHLFSEFCDEQGISHEFSAPITPQQNGVVERKNRVLLDMSRVMLNSANLAKHFWAEAISSACYTANRVYLRPKSKATPYELWKGKKPNVSHLRVFGSTCYIYKDREHLSKFDSRSDIGIFLGYSLTSKAYRVYNIRTKSVMESINVVINDSDLKQVKQINDDDDLTGMQTEHRCDQVQAANDAFSITNSEDIHDTSSQTLRIGAKQVKRDHKPENIIGKLHDKMRTRSQDVEEISYLCYVSQIEPKNVKEAIVDNDWILAIQEELNQFERNDVWYLVPRPKDANVIGTKWIFRNKTDEKGKVIRNKARLVAQGYTQVEGLDFDETFAPVARLESVRLLLAIACHLRIKLYQMDVKSAFLNGVLQEEVYVEQPAGFKDHFYPDHVYRLKKALYGLKQAPRTWYERLSSYLLQNGYTRGAIDKTLFVKRVKSDLVVAQVYVDDIVFGSTSNFLVTEFTNIMSNEFEMSMCGELNYFLGLQVQQLKDGMFLSQTKYAKDLVAKFGLESAKPVRNPMSTTEKLHKDPTGEQIDQKLYRSMIGSLLYLTASRPDISFSVGVCARFQACPKQSHLAAVKRIIRYISGTLHFGIHYSFDSNVEIAGFSDADWAGNIDDRKSTSGGCFYLGNNLVAWHSKKQKCVSLSTAEAEYIAAGSCCTQLLWMKQMLCDYGIVQGTLIIFCDNQSAINISKNPLSTLALNTLIYGITLYVIL
ncbi:unnamed protein product [Prunus brigantina]